jgi:hypothetical protein
MLRALKRRLSVWETVLTHPKIEDKDREEIANEVLYLYSAMEELTPPPSTPPAVENGTPTNGTAPVVPATPAV